MSRFVLPDNPANGGLPEPLADEPVRVIAARHDACGEATRVRLPGTIPASVVRRVRCAGCEQEFDSEGIEEIGVEQPGRWRRLAISRPTLPKLSGPKLSRPKLPKLNPQSRGWRLASIPIAAAAVIGGLMLVQGGDEPAPSANQASASGSATVADPPPSAGEGKVSQKTKLVRGSSYSLALPAGWERIDPSGGATFAAVAADGGADVTLWIKDDPELDFPVFISQSIDQLEALAGSARVVERVPAPTPEATIVRLAADAPAGQPSYEVTLRVAGPYRYYLATSVAPDASREAVEGAELVAGSFTPEQEG